MRIAWNYALVALVAASVAWYAVSGREKVDTWLELPVELEGMPQGMVVLEGLPTRVKVRVRAPKLRTRSLDLAGRAYPLDMSGLAEGDNVLAFQPADAPLPAAFEVVEFDPPRVRLAADRTVVRDLEVAPDWTAAWDAAHAKELYVERLRVQPPSVTVRGPFTLVGNYTRMVTSPFALNATAPGAVAMEALVLPPQTRDILPDAVVIEPPRVEVLFLVRARTANRTVEAPVSVVIPPSLNATALVEPPRLRMVLAVPLSQAGNKTLAQGVNATVILPEGAGAGTVEAEYELRLPPGSALVSVEPPTVRVTLRAP